MKNKITVDEYIINNERWHIELVMLREIFLSTGLTEEIKWGMPVYTLGGKNIAGMSAFKSYVGIWFYQGVFLKDQNKKLLSADDQTKALRKWRFDSADEIQEDAEIIQQYFEEAIENQKAGKEIKPDRNKPLVIPPELKELFKERPSLKQSFDSLTLTQKRDSTHYISSAKREETKLKRLDKIIPLIMNGVGPYDRHR